MLLLFYRKIISEFQTSIDDTTAQAQKQDNFGKHA